jgi:thioredoxin-like negative regulator of GroEL
MSEPENPLPPSTIADATSLRQQLLAGADPTGQAKILLTRLRGQPKEVYIEQARALLDQGLPGIVMVVLQDAVLQWPEDVELRHWLGNAMRLCGEADGAESAFRSALQIDPQHERSALALAHMLRDAGRLDAATAVVVELNERLPPAVGRTLRDVQFLEGCRRFGKADRLCERQLQLSPDDPQLLFSAGQMALVLGDFDRARRHLLAALQHGLDVATWSGAWLFLASTRRYDSAADPDLERFRTAWNDARLPDAARAAGAFAYGKACDDLRLYQEATAAFREANALARTRHTWSAAAWSGFVAAQTRAPSLPPIDAAGDGSIVPVFVVGLPRSGTTLVAELLGRHPQVCNRGERSWIPYLDQQLAAGNSQRNPEALRRAAGIYLAHLRQDDAPARWYVDKNPLNFRHLGLIAAMLPQARIIHCSRSRRDTALSIWCQYFEHQDNNFAYDWNDIAAFAAGEDQLMRHWKQNLRLPIHTVDYQRLAEQPEQVLAGIGDFLGLPPQDLLQTQAKADSAIATSSVWQARQPVYRSSVERWKAYLPYIPELAFFKS